MTTETEVLKLCDEADSQPDGLLKVSLFEEAVRRADVLEDTLLAYDVRMALVESAFYSGEAAKMLNALAWCLATYDSTPERFDRDMLLHSCDLAAGYICSFPTISREQIEQLLDNIEHRYTVEGRSTRSVVIRRCFNAFWMGDHELARAMFDKAWTLPDDEDWDGGAYEALSRCDFWLHMGEDEKALAAIQRHLAATRDFLYPWMSSYSLQALLRVGRVEEARQLQKASYRRLPSNPKYLEHVSHHVHSLLGLGNVKQAVTLYERHHDWVVTCVPRDQFEFFLATWGICRHLVRKKKGSLRLSLRPEFTWAESVATVAAEGNSLTATAADLEPVIAEHVRGLASQFNARNGNDYFDRLIGKFQSLQDLSC